MREDFVPFGAERIVEKPTKLQHPVFSEFSARFGITDKKGVEKGYGIILILITLFVISSIFGTVAWYFNIDKRYTFFLDL